MPLCTDHFSLYHCPRTGGTWVRAVFDALGIGYRVIGLHHSTPADVPLSGFTFSIRRDLADWLRSWRTLVAGNPHWSWSVPQWLLKAKTVEDAEAVMDRFCEGVDFVCHTETLRADLQAVFDAVGLAETVPDLPPNNRTPVDETAGPAQ